MPFTTLALYARNEDTRQGFRWAAARAGLTVLDLTADPSSVAAAVGVDVAVRAPGGLVASAMAAGAMITLAGPTPRWFEGLDPEVTGRAWKLCTPARVREMLVRRPTFVKLADGKHPAFPATRFDSVAAFDQALHLVGAGSVEPVGAGSADLELLATTGWLSIDSEYRVFTRAREVMAHSPYRVQDEPWSPLLRTHRASFHQEATQWAEAFLAHLADDQLPPAAVLDVARLTSGRFVLLEVNQCWGAGLYGCDPAGALDAVVAANAPGAVGNGNRWLWTPDPHLGY